MYTFSLGLGSTEKKIDSLAMFPHNPAGAPRAIDGTQTCLILARDMPFLNDKSLRYLNPMVCSVMD
jgi:hypothetical protein